ncbi:polymorphic toxin-type HINT domain-containing protein, partial [Virgisporangium aurantiacum]|uniref:polymorphic toxin-type HINT domain-containing protein n=1 Tax=Virgisporangium aurantiacum TaxID=175570 RepID=UPI001EF27C7B
KKATAVYHATTSYVSRKVTTVKKAVKKAVKKVVKKVKKAVKKVVSKVKRFVKHTYQKAKKWVKKKYNAVKRKVKKLVRSAKKWVAKKVAAAKKKLKSAYNRVKQAGKKIVAKTVRAVKKAASKVADAYHATEKWVKDHKNAIIEVAAIVGGIAAGIACTAATAGAGAVACMVGAAAIINLAKDAAQGNIHNWGDAFGSLGTGALQGAAGVFGGAVGGKIASALAGKLGSAAGSLGGRMLTGGAAGGVSDAVTQFASTGKVNLRDVGMSTVLGAVTAGRGKSRTSCSVQPHSFSPDTKVLMAGGATKSIKDIRIGDRVIATDPATGRTEERTVTKQHINRDRDLTDVNVRTADGRTATVRTTQKHPFWDQKAKQFVAAGALIGAVLLGAQATTTDSAAAAPTSPVVESVANYTGDRIMYDLTVDDIHTYYVVADDTPVLVHNCGGEVNGGLPDHPEGCWCDGRRWLERDADGNTVVADSGFEDPIQRRRDDVEARVGAVRRGGEWAEAGVDVGHHGPHIELSDPITQLGMIGLIFYESWKLRKRGGGIGPFRRRR